MKAMLTTDPDLHLRSLAELAGIAEAIETEAAERYGWLAGEMERRGESEVAETFRRLAEEEGRHLRAVGRWAAKLAVKPATRQSFSWRLPRDLAESTEDASASALLTPYKALAIAVENEERTFSFFAYLAAEASDPRVAAEAEKLASEELRHAALLRTWRRAAFHREQAAAGGHRAPRRRIRSSGELARAIVAAEEETVLCHRQLAGRLKRGGDEDSAQLIAELAAEAEREAGHPPPGGACEADECRADRPLPLLLAAQRPLERLAETLEAVLTEPPDEESRLLAETKLEDVVARIARIGRRIEILER